ncbi:hypothetical protein [Nostoc sp.]|uniref:hypothetical protein n=1 Tax=Nostoc sp. TaxID=1180 RepID=UPI002FF863C3
MAEDNTEIILIPTKITSSQIENSITALDKPYIDLLNYLGLPTDNIFSPVHERRKAICALYSILEMLPIEKKSKAIYLSKFVASIIQGLFDGALAFLWDETIKALNRLIIGYDLQYFYDVAGTVSSKYKGLDLEDELEAISAHDLLEISQRIGLINDINSKRLETVNYFRNHASSAHSNDNELSGTEMIVFLEYCLKYVINAKPDYSVVILKQLRDNIRKNVIHDDDFTIIGNDFSKQPQVRKDDFLMSVFGIYCDPKQEQYVRVNIEKLIPNIWNNATDEAKYRIGSKFGLYRKNADTFRREATERILELVDGLRYKDEDSLAAELIEKLQNLRTIHFEYNNFYNEYPHAKSISVSIPTSGIPKSVRSLFVKIICICYCGNSKGYKNGIDEKALPYYEKFIEGFKIEEIKEYIKLFSDNEFVFDLDTPKADPRMRELANSLRDKTTDVHINKALYIISSFPKSKLPKISLDSSYQEAIKYI